MTTTALPPPGWYADPWRVTTWRWWDGGGVDGLHGPAVRVRPLIRGRPAVADESLPIRAGWTAILGMVVGVVLSIAHLCRRLRASASAPATRSSLLVAQLGLWVGLVGACVDRGPAPRHRPTPRPRAPDPRGSTSRSASATAIAALIGVGDHRQGDHQHRHRAAPRGPRGADAPRHARRSSWCCHRRRRRTVRRGAVLPRPAHERARRPLRRRARDHPAGRRVRARAPRPDRRLRQPRRVPAHRAGRARCSACCASATSVSAPGCSRTRATTRSSSRSRSTR